jgi:LysR family transcriptional regulator, transcriptional activator for dmlA
MEIDAVRLFVSVVDHGSIAAAARAAGVSPSVASRRVAALESSLGALLLVRTTRSVAPTPAGATLLEWARKALMDWTMARERIAAMQGKASGLVRIASNDYAAATYLPSILADFAGLQPDVRVVISIAQEPAKLLAGACDLAIHAGRRPDADLVGRRIWEYSRRLVAAPGYVVRRRTPTSLAQLVEHSCLTHTVSEPGEWHFEDGLGKLQAVRVNAQMSSDSWGVLLELALAGAGVARLSDSLVREPIADGRLVTLLPEFRSVYPDGDPPAMWVLTAHRDLPLRIRLLADHISEGLLNYRRIHRP